MNRLKGLFIPLLVLPILFFLGAPHVYGEQIGTHPQSAPAGEGYWCFDCHEFETSPPNQKWVKTEIDLLPWHLEYLDPPPSTGKVSVTYTNPLTQVNGQPYYDGPCEACHTQTSYHRNDGTGPGGLHHEDENCVGCHMHFQVTMFRGQWIGPQSHWTHLVNPDTLISDPKGPAIEDCTVCHNPDDFSMFGPGSGQSIDDTDVCDTCHSPDGAANGKLKWEDGVYKPNGYELMVGNENWCATCHDDGISTVNGIDAPNVMGDGETYGYNVSGHGAHTVLCGDCHDFALLHTDGDARTYSAATNNYRDGYRLNEDMAVPRDGEIHPEAFRLCTTCHKYTDITGPTSNFRDDHKGGMQFHDMHLNGWPWYSSSDSDFDETIDSAVTCINCHNAHGSRTPAMVRSGELISTPGTTDKVPALRLRWYMKDGVTQTKALEYSRYGNLRCGAISSSKDVSVNHVCAGCHATGELVWYRNPGGRTGVTLSAVWTSNLSNVPKTEFAPNEDVRYHARIVVLGSDRSDESSYLVIVAKSMAGNVSWMPGTDWLTRLSNKGATIPEGAYEITWDETIPGEATPGSPAKLLIQVGMLDSPGGTLISTDKRISDFYIVPDVVSTVMTDSGTPLETDSGVGVVSTVMTDSGTPLETDSGAGTIPVNDVNLPPVLDPIDNKTVNVTVVDVNRSPVLDAIGDMTIDEEKPLEFTITATDPDGDDLTYSVSNLPGGASFDQDTQVFSWTPDYDQAGNYPNLLFTVTDSISPDTEEAITITVNDVNLPPVLDPIDNKTVNVSVGDVNLPPVLDPIDNKTVNEGELLGFTITATDPDGDDLTYSAGNLPDGASFNQDTQVFSWKPDHDQVGEYPNVLFTVTDGDISDPETITITVVPRVEILVKPDSIHLKPDSDSTFEVRQGESLHYTGTLTNNTDQSQSFRVARQIWDAQETKKYWERVGSLDTFTAHQTKQYNLSMDIPTGTPLGSYILKAFIGTSLSDIWDSAEFEFSVVK